MDSMFAGCESLTSLNLNSFNTSKVENMAGMFRGCDELINLNIDNFDTSKVINMEEMFRWSTKVRTSMTIKNIGLENYYEMFQEAATEESAQIKLNYTEETSELVNNMINTKPDNSHVIKGEKISL